MPKILGEIVTIEMIQNARGAALISIVLSLISILSLTLVLAMLSPEQLEQVIEHLD